MKHLIFKLCLAGIFSLLAGNVTLAETIDIGTRPQRMHIYRTDSPEASDSYGSQANDVRYRFRVENSTVFLAHHGGSELRWTSMYLRYKDMDNNDEEFHEIHASHNSRNKEDASALLNELYERKEELAEELDSLHEEQAFLCLLLKRGEYELVCEGRKVKENRPCNGELHTHICTHQAGSRIEHPIDLGSHSCCYTYQDVGRYSIGYTTKHYVFYKVRAEFPMHLKAAAYSSKRIQVVLLNEQEEELEIKSKDNCLETTVTPGTYIIRAGTHDEDIWQDTEITLTPSVPGNCPDAPLLITPSEQTGNLSFSRYFDTNNYTDNYQGSPSNDICIALQLTDSLLTNFLFDSEEMEGGIYLTRLDSTQQEVERIFISDPAGKEGSRFFALPPGKHYFVCEGAETNGMFQLSIEGRLPYREKHERYTPTENMNYIRTIIPRQQCNTADSLYYLNKTVHQIEYFDHLGRPVQEVAFKASPEKDDLIFHHEYDMMGRNAKQWSGIARKNEIEWETKKEIGNLTAGTYLSPEKVQTLARQQYTDKAPYSFPVYENSLWNRIAESYGAGEAWQETGRSFKTRYAFNTEADRCLRFTVKGERANPQIALAGIYPATQLDATQHEDEDGHAKYTFTDRWGHSVLTREIAGQDTLDTYYVYDDYNNLCFVLPPAALPCTHEDTLPEISQEILDTYGYQYRYDNRNRCITKKLPGCEPVAMIYDDNNRLVFTQDGEQRKRNEWSIQLSDLTGRHAMSGIYRGTPDREKCEMENIYAVFNPIAENPLYGYRLNLPEHISMSQLEILKADYYDNYAYQRHLTEFGGTPQLQYISDRKYGERHIGNLHCKLLLTGSMVFTPESQTATHTCYYYDYNRNLVQTRSTTHNGVTTVTKAKYNFTGQPVKVKEEYGDSLSLQKEMKYDHIGRLTAETHIVNDKDTVRFSYGYDKLGKLQSLTRSANGGKPVTTRYEYNIRDWVTAIESPLFSQKIHYTDGEGAPCYNGNISSMTWQTGNVPTDSKKNAPKGMSTEKGYKFHYDGLSRLTDAVYGEGVSLSNNLNRFNEQITGYDKMGNILGLKRYGQTTASAYGLIDDLSLSYDGNQLQTVNDNSLNSVYVDGFEFKDGAKEDIEYAYDSNGNLIQDLNKKITDIRYNYLNLPRRIEFENGNCISCLYDANGTKLRTTHVIGKDTTVTDYCGNAVYENGVPLTLLTQYGYVSLSDNKYHYYIQDHQGNNRVVADENGSVEEVNEYYPFGGLMASSTNSVQPYKYNGKELDRKGGLDWYDYGARMYDAALGRFTGPDPLAEAWAHANPYNYCFNNPVNRTDPTGMASVYNWNTKRYEDESGNEVSWESVQQEYGIGDSQNYDDPPSGKDVDATTGATPKVNPNTVYTANFSGLITGEPAFLPGKGFMSLKQLRILLKEGIKSLKGINFETFRQFKSVFGSAGEGKAWHHIVEQTPGNIQKFGARSLQNTDNLIKLPHGPGTIHEKISAFYSSKPKFTNGLTVREWLSTQTFQQQYDFGIKTLKDFGWKP